MLGLSWGLWWPHWGILSRTLVGVVLRDSCCCSGVAWCGVWTLRGVIADCGVVSGRCAVFLCCCSALVWCGVWCRGAWALCHAIVFSLESRGVMSGIWALCCATVIAALVSHVVVRGRCAV